MCLLSTGSRVRVPPGSPDQPARFPLVRGLAVFVSRICRVGNLNTQEFRIWNAGLKSSVTESCRRLQSTGRHGWRAASPGTSARLLRFQYSVGQTMRPVAPRGVEMTISEKDVLIWFGLPDVGIDPVPSVFRQVAEGWPGHWHHQDQVLDGEVRGERCVNLTWRLCGDDYPGGRQVVPPASLALQCRIKTRVVPRYRFEIICDDQSPRN